GVELYEDYDGKLFPTTDSARTVLEALVGEAQRKGVHIMPGTRVTAIQRAADGFQISTRGGALHADMLVLATGGKSLPKTGSDGAGYECARQLGHSIVPTTPGLVPLVLDGDFHKTLSGISQDVELTVRAAGAKQVRIHRAMLWTHFGI